jgi:hypothetical protein
MPDRCLHDLFSSSIKATTVSPADRYVFNNDTNIRPPKKTVKRIFVTGGRAGAAPPSGGKGVDCLV